jgi:hypothetical protein
VQRVQREGQECQRGTAWTGLEYKRRGKIDYRQFTAASLAIDEKALHCKVLRAAARTRGPLPPDCPRGTPRSDTDLYTSRARPQSWRGVRPPSRPSGSRLRRGCSPGPGPVGPCVLVLRVVLVPPPAACLTRPRGPGRVVDPATPTAGLGADSGWSVDRPNLNGPWPGPGLRIMTRVHDGARGDRRASGPSRRAAGLRPLVASESAAAPPGLIPTDTQLSAPICAS